MPRPQVDHLVLEPTGEVAHDTEYFERSKQRLLALFDESFQHNHVTCQLPGRHLYQVFIYSPAGIGECLNTVQFTNPSDLMKGLRKNYTAKDSLQSLQFLLPGIGAVKSRYAVRKGLLHAQQKSYFPQQSVLATRSTIWAKQCTANMLTPAPPSPRSCTSLEAFLMFLAPLLTQDTQRLISIPSRLYRSSTPVARATDTSSGTWSNFQNMRRTRPLVCSKRNMTTNHSSPTLVTQSLSGAARHQWLQ